MSNAAAQAALGGHKMDEITTNLPPRRSSVAISTKLHHTTNEKEAAPRGAKTNGNYGQLNRSMLIVELPAEILVKIMNYMSFNEIGQVRLVSNITFIDLVLQPYNFHIRMLNYQHIL